MMRHDPILQFGRLIQKELAIAQGVLDAIDNEVQEQVSDAVRFADQSPWPGPETLFEDVYVRSPYIHPKTAERDPAWRAASREDRVPEGGSGARAETTPAKVEG